MEQIQDQVSEQEMEREARIDSLLEDLIITNDSYEAARKAKEVRRLITGDSESAAESSAEGTLDPQTVRFMSKKYRLPAKLIPAMFSISTVCGLLFLSINWHLQTSFGIVVALVGFITNVSGLIWWWCIKHQL